MEITATPGVRPPCLHRTQRKILAEKQIVSTQEQKDRCLTLCEHFIACERFPQVVVTTQCCTCKSHWSLRSTHTGINKSLTGDIGTPADRPYSLESHLYITYPQKCYLSNPRLGGVPPSFCGHGSR